MTELFDDDDLFAPRPVAKVVAQPEPKFEPVCQPPAPLRKRPVAVHTRPLPVWTGPPVASYACICGAREEVREPAPETVDCWHCKAALAMARWSPKYEAPIHNARRLTAAERARINLPAAG